MSSVKLGAWNIHYEKVGSGPEHVLLLPGALGSSMTDFGPQINGGFDDKKFTLIAWDPPGYGKSRPPDRTWPLHFLERDACVASELMQELSIPQYSLLRWSDGGITALMIAARQQKAVKKMVVFGANAFVNDHDLQLYEQVRDVSQWSARMREPYEKMYGAEYFKTNWEQWVSSLNRYASERNGDICKDELKNIVCPTLVIHGQKDAMVGQDHAEYLNAHIDKSRLHLMPDGKHNLHFKYAKEFNSMVSDFILEKSSL